MKVSIAIISNENFHTALVIPIDDVPVISDSNLQPDIEANRLITQVAYLEVYLNEDIINQIDDEQYDSNISLRNYTTILLRNDSNGFRPSRYLEIRCLIYCISLSLVIIFLFHPKTNIEDI